MNREDIFRMAMEASATGCGDELTGDAIERFAELVAAAEREACAKVCDERAKEDGWEGCYANECAEAIRARK